MRDPRPKPPIARFRTLLRAHVDWLRGVPLAVESGSISWLVLPTGERDAGRIIRVDRTTLSEATRCVHELSREPATLARIVGDVDRWKTRVLAAIEHLKPSVHHGADVGSEALVSALPAGLARRAEEALADEEKRPVAELLLFAYALDPDELRTALGALDAETDLLVWLLAHDERVACLAVIRLSIEERSRSKPLFALLRELIESGLPNCDRQAFLDAFPVPINAVPSMIAVRPSKPIARLADKSDALPRFLAWLARQDGSTRRSALSIFAASAPRAILRKWTEAHRELAVLDAKARKRKEWSSESILLTELRRLKEHLPPSFQLARYLDAVVALTSDDAIVQPIVRALAGVPDMARPRFVEHWAELFPTLEPLERRGAPEYVKAFAAYLATADREHLSPWSIVLFELDKPLRRWSSPDDDVLAALRKPAEFARFFATLGAMEDVDPDLVLELLELGIDAPTAIARANAIRASEEYIETSKRGLRVAHELHPRTDVEFAQLAAMLCTRGAERLVRNWSRLGPLDGETRASIRRTFLAAPATVERASSLMELASEVPPLMSDRGARTAEWIRRYPSELHSALARLTEATASRVLRVDFPSDEALTEQIAALERKPDAPRARVATLRSRIGAKRKLSPLRLKNLARKLERAADRTRWETWLSRLEAACVQRITQLLSVESCPSWALENENLAIIAGAVQLEPPHRDLALRMLRVRAGPPPWDLRDAPENVAVLESLARRGIDTAPWVDGIGVVERAGPESGTRVFLSLTDDPLEIFKMGERFGTCLSVGASNFFSTFANAADIDKRVLYARDESGRPLGRCLLALDDDGHVLTFHPYAHVQPEFYGVLFAEFAGVLAERMGAVCAPRGRVRARVARDWYDDGPRDLTGQFSFLENHSSDFHTALVTVAEQDMIALCERSFAPRALDGLTIPLVLELHELRQRPALARPLLDRLLAEGSPLSDSLRITAAHLALRAGDRERARQLAGGAVAAELEAELARDPEHVDGRLIELLLELDPAKVLQITRRTARRFERGGYQSRARLLLAARALERVGRPRRALAILRELPRRPDIDELIARVQARLAG